MHILKDVALVILGLLFVATVIIGLIIHQIEKNGWEQ